MTKVFLVVILLFFLVPANAQITEISGKVIAKGDVENIHVINKTSKKYATTNTRGNFTIEVKQKDTLVFSSIQYKLKAIYVDATVLSSKYLEVALEDYLNELDQVTVGRVLTKDLESDIENSQAKPKINFYDVGIPGYKGKQPTQKERLLIEADHGKFLYFYGLGFAINVNKILNRVSGRTNKLKQLVKLEKRDALMFELRIRFSDALFEGETFGEHQKMDFFFFCSEDENFEKRCRIENNLMILEYLKEKLLAYKNNMKN